MRHPFDGINVPQAQPSRPAPEQKSRRSFFKILAGALAGLFGLVSRARAQAPQKGALSLALGEAGGTALTQAFKEEAGDPTKDPTKMRNEEGGPTTDAVGEQGGVTTKALGEEGATTNALNEEGATKALGEQGGVTTRAVGEEGGRLTKALNEGGVGPTTLAIGEEGGRRIPRLTNALGEDGGATTFAVGEEGGQN